MPITIFFFTMNGKFKMQKVPKSFLYRVYYYCANDYKYANDVIAIIYLSDNAAMRS